MLFTFFSARSQEKITLHPLILTQDIDNDMGTKGKNKFQEALNRQKKDTGKRSVKKTIAKKT